jgi:transposase-like protein
MGTYQATKSSRRYDAEFKENAVSLVLAGRSYKDVARDLGVSGWSLRVWHQRHQQGQKFTQSNALAALTPEQRENRRLRQEVAYLQRQRDILKKALAIVSDGHLNDASSS